MTKYRRNADAGECNLHDGNKHCRKMRTHYFHRCSCEHCADFRILLEAMVELSNLIHEGKFTFDRNVL